MSERNQSRLLTVGEVAKRSGVAISTLHFYESKGLIKSIRTNGNQRRFTLVVLRYIAIIKIAQKVGIPLDEIKQALSKYPMGSKLLHNNGKSYLSIGGRIWMSVFKNSQDSETKWIGVLDVVVCH